jgi:hypothetical protein
MWSLSTYGDKQKLATSLSLQREDVFTFGLTTGDEVDGMIRKVRCSATKVSITI